MLLVRWIEDGRVKSADKEDEIFYALKFTYNKIGKNGVGPYYSLCLPNGGSNKVTLLALKGKASMRDADPDSLHNPELSQAE